MKEIALSNEILRGLVGSGAHGTAIEGQDDRDEMAVFIEPAANVCGLSPVDHYIHRTAAEGVRSGPGDLDLTMYSLRKFCRLARQGNPSILLLLWLPEYIVASPAGGRLLAIRDAFHSQEAGKRHLGYLISQKKALLGERSPKVSRPEMVAKYGFDTKFAMHALRLGYQGVEYMTTGALEIPVAEPNLSTLRAVRGGQIPFDETLRLIEEVEAKLISAIDSCASFADRKRIDDFLVTEHWKHWAHALPMVATALPLGEVE